MLGLPADSPNPDLNQRMYPFPLHAFISYAHLDNQPLEPGQEGWVTQFHRLLSARLSVRLGDPVTIWRDSKLSGDDVFSDEILDQFDKVALLVSVLTPRYVRSIWCQREVDAFTKAAQRQGGVQVQNKSRVIKVLKTPLQPGDQEPPPLDQTLGHAFFKTDSDLQEEFDPAFGPEARQEFNRRVDALAVAMMRNLQVIGGSEVGRVRPSGQTVFVAECGRDMQSLRDQLVTDLLLHGHDVVPDRPLPLVEDGLRALLATELASADLVVHLIGSSSSPVPAGPSGLSLVALQNEVAAALPSSARRRRIIWLAPGAQGERPEHQRFIDDLQQRADLQRGADLLRGEAQALTAAVHDALRQCQQAGAVVAVPAPAGPRQVYLLMGAGDRQATLPLIKALRAQGLAVVVPEFTGDAAELRAAHAQRVISSDAVLLYCGCGDEAWRVHQGNDLRKQAAGGARAGSPWLLLAPPLTPDKELQQALAEPRTIDLLAGLQDGVLAPLALALAAAEVGR